MERELYKSPIRMIFEKLSPTTKTDTVFGDPVELENKKVVPVSKVTYLVGGGGGKGDTQEENDMNSGEGEGGGGSIFVKPVGVYEITKEKTRFIPTIDLSALFMIASFMMMVISLLFRINKKK